MTSEVFEFSDLVRAWRDKRSFSNAHEDLRDYHGRRYTAFAAAFGADLDRPPATKPAMPTWMVEWHNHQPPRSVRPLDHPVWWGQWPKDVHRFALRADERERELYGPFSGYVERPPALSALSDRFGQGIADPLRAARMRIAELIFEVMAVLYPAAAARTITTNDLRAAGFDPSGRRPEPMNYW